MAWRRTKRLIDRVGGAAASRPTQAAASLSSAAQELVAEACEGLDGLVDHHVHALALGTDAEHAFIHPRNLSPRHPYRHLKYLIFLSAGGVADAADADRAYAQRLLERARALPVPSRLHLLAFDRVHDEVGVPDTARTELYVPNEYVYQLCAAHPDLLQPVASVHPRRRDALAVLTQAAAQGCQLVKWLPSTMGIDPLDQRNDPFFERMRELGLVLLSHAGAEFSLEGVGDQELNNPLRLRRALDHGVRVIAAHCASAGRSQDLDRAGARRASSFKLLLRLLEEPRWEGRLFADISAITVPNRFPGVLGVLLDREELHPRLVHGSDYPVPAINALMPTAPLVAAGFLKRTQARVIKELYRANPLLFELVLKRSLRSPRSGRRFPAAVFDAQPALGGV